MTERYDRATAEHYAAYRPPLHRLLLERVINPSESFRSGLDIGCGTGYSAIALAEHCDRVCGADINQQMLKLAESHPKVTYAQMTAGSFTDLPGRPFDIVTFAGSLYYTKSAELRNQLSSNSCLSPTVIVYDFNVLANELMKRLGISVSIEQSEYDFDINISDWSEFETVAADSERMNIEVSKENAAHVLLSNSFRYDQIQRAIGSQNVFETLVSRLEHHKGSIYLEADVWSKRYQMTHQDRNTR